MERRQKYSNQLESLSAGNVVITLVLLLFHRGGRGGRGAFETGRQPPSVRGGRIWNRQGQPSRLSNPVPFSSCAGTELVGGEVVHVER